MVIVVGGIIVVVQCAKELPAERGIAKNLAAAELRHVAGHEQVAPGRHEGHRVAELPLQALAGGDRFGPQFFSQ